MSCQVRGKQQPLQLPEKFQGITIWNTALCNMGCKYCVKKGTLILMGDLTWKPIEQIKSGDEVIGVEFGENGKHMRFKKTVVKVVTSRKSKIWKVIHTKGEIEITDNHAILSKYKRWLSINPSETTEVKAYKLNKGNLLKFISQPIQLNETEEYMIGYLNGIFAGDGTFTDRKYDGKVVRHARLAMKDEDVLIRVSKYLDILGIEYSWGEHKYNGEYSSGVMKKITLYQKDNIAKLKKPIETIEEKRGYIAGFFDAEGSFDGENIRLSNKNLEKLRTIVQYLKEFGFNAQIESYSDASAIRIVGKQDEKIRFFATFKPAIMRKMSKLFEKTVKGEVEVKEIIPGDEEEVYNLQTETENYIAGGLIVHNCFVYKLYPNQPNRSLSDEVINALPNFVKKYMIDNPEIWFFGGEPLASFDTIKKVFNVLTENNIIAHYGLTSNLTLLDEEKAKWLGERRFGILCSIDGGKESHNMNRVYKDGKGTWDDVMKGLKLVRQYINPSPNIRWTVEPRNVKYVYEDVKEFFGMGLTTLAIDPVYEVEWKDEDVEEYVNQLEKVAQYIIHTHHMVALKPFQDLLPLISGQPLDWRYRCGLAQGSLGMGADGKLHNCHRFVSSQSGVIGDVFNGIDQNMRKKYNEEYWKVRPYSKTLDCSTCPLQEMCNGGCLAVNYDMNKDMHVIPESFCKIYQAYVKRLLPYVLIMKARGQLMIRKDRIVNVPPE
jgi:radical SAM protein with 4Fe4S-binding SPASM domain